MSKRKALSSNNRTYLAMTIPIVILFFLFNTLPLITGAVYSFTNYRGYGPLISWDCEIISTCFLMNVSCTPTCSHSSMRLPEPFSSTV